MIENPLALTFRARKFAIRKDLDLNPYQDMFSNLRSHLLGQLPVVIRRILTYFFDFHKHNISSILAVGKVHLYSLPSPGTCDRT